MLINMLGLLSSLGGGLPSHLVLTIVPVIDIIPDCDLGQNRVPLFRVKTAAQTSLQTVDQWCPLIRYSVK